MCYERDFRTVRLSVLRNTTVPRPRVRAAVLIFSALVIATFALGQPASQGIEPFRFTVFSARPTSGLAFFPGPELPPQPLIFYPTARSPEYEYTGAIPLQFIDELTGEVVATVTTLPHSRRALLLFVPVAAGSANPNARYQIVALDDSALGHVPGGLTIINLSGLVLQGTINSRRVALRTGLNRALDVGESAAIELRTIYKGRSYHSYRDTAVLSAGERALLILLPPFYSGSLEIQGRLLLDVPTPEPLRR
jgi:hypothetical protein